MWVKVVCFQKTYKKFRSCQEFRQIFLSLTVFKLSAKNPRKTGYTCMKHVQNFLYVKKMQKNR